MKKFLIIALLLLYMVSAGAARGLPFMEDSYGAALSQAKQRGLPIFVECWAPW